MRGREREMERERGRERDYIYILHLEGAGRCFRVDTPEKRSSEREIGREWE